ncbi:glycosyltransferase family 4 protein [Sphingomonas azotifigens]|uniref:glycosyltransferase family 4 protein n=1 Tax=Sphingomonas azotifigens TaxID=330920 RepID=UPI00111C54E8|nr:glycosyltransferase family 4 protein [Sphingomonas azotifigens]
MTRATPLRLLLTTDTVGGVWQYSIDLAGALADRGVETVLTQLGPAPSDAQRAEASAIPGLTFLETGLPLDWLSLGPAPVLAAGTEVGRLARLHGVDLVQLNMPTLAASADPGAPVLAVTHGCVSTWWQHGRAGVPLDPNFAWHRALTEQGLLAADRVVAPSAGYAEVVHATYALPRLPTVVHNGRAPLVTPKHEPVQDCVLTVGRLWDSVKGAALLDQVAARLSVPFHAAGAAVGPHGETVQLENLHLLGQLDPSALAHRLAARPVFVSAASFEPFGLAVLEAAAAGCALVLADIRVLRELWDGVALFVPPRDAAAYTDAIERLIGDLALRRNLGDAAAERAHRYTPTRMADAMLPLYRQLLAERAPAGKAAA